MKDFYTTKEAAAELEVSDAYIRQMILSGKIVAEKTGRDHFISANELEKARQRRTKRGPEPKLAPTSKGQAAKPAAVRKKSSGNKRGK